MRLVDLGSIWDNKKRKFDEKAFSEDCGPRVPSDISSQIFLSSFLENLIDRIVNQTNLYGQQLGRSFGKVNKAEMLKFLEINMMMGINRLPLGQSR